MTLTSATTYLQKGKPYEVAVGLSEAVSTPLTIQLTYGGTARQGTDYTVPSGSIVVPAGQTSDEVEIPTVTNNTVESDRVLERLAGREPGYQVGTPSSATVTITSSVVPMLTIAATASTIPRAGRHRSPSPPTRRR